MLAMAILKDMMFSDLDFIIGRIEGIGFCSMFFLLAAGNLNICSHEARYLLLQPNTD